MHFFQLPHIYLAFAALAAMLCACVFMARHHEKAAVISLCAGAFVLRLFVAGLDPFLHDWDERFHALVGANMIDHPFTPMLRVHAMMPYDPYAWCCNHIWLHKQPLFLWQIALSVKLFGHSTMAVRYPSIIMGTLMVPLIYSLTKMLTTSRSTAFLAALLLTCSAYHMELISGYYNTDHNDVAFAFYVLFSLWALARFLQSRKMRYALLTGLLAGGAVLIKWLTGMLVLGVWTLTDVLPGNTKALLKRALPLTLAVSVCMALWLPWQWHILHAFPAEAKYEYAYNARHITQVVEDHRGSALFYLGKFPLYFGVLSWPLVVAGFFIVLWQAWHSKYNRQLGAGICIAFAVVFLFFSLVVKTKLSSFLVPVAAFGLTFIAIALAETYRRWAKTPYLAVAVCAILCIGLLRPDQLQANHDPADTTRQMRMHNTEIYCRLKTQIPADVHLVLNANSFEDLDAMYYNPGTTVYGFMLTAHLMDSLKTNKVPFAVFKEHKFHKLPGDINTYPGVFIINEDVW